MKYTTVSIHENYSAEHDPYTEVVEADSPYDAWLKTKQLPNYFCVAIFKGALKNLMEEIE